MRDTRCSAGASANHGNRDPGAECGSVLRRVARRTVATPATTTPDIPITDIRTTVSSPFTETEIASGNEATREGMSTRAGRPRALRWARLHPGRRRNHGGGFTGGGGMGDKSAVARNGGGGGGGQLSAATICRRPRDANAPRRDYRGLDGASDSAYRRSVRPCST